MSKLLTNILFLFAVAHFQQSEAIVPLKSAISITNIALAGLAPYTDFLDEPNVFLLLFQTFTGMNIKSAQPVQAQLDEISAKINMICETVLRFREEVIAKITTLSKRTELTTKLRDFYKHIDYIDSQYENYYVNYVNLSKHYFPGTREDFSNQTLSSREYGMNQHLDRIHRLLLERDTTDKNIPMYYAEDDDLVKMLVCQKKQSAQRLIYSTYELVAVAEMKGIIMLCYAYETLRQVYPNITTNELDDSKLRQEKRMKKTLEAIREIAEKAPREIWPCDPKYHDIGITYEKVAPIFQKFVMFEGDVVKLPSGFANKRYAVFPPIDRAVVELPVLCGESCPKLSYADTFHCSTNYSKLCKSSKKFACNGIARDCEYEHKYLTICPAGDNDERRYTSIKTGVTTYGEGGNCKSPEFQANSWYAFGTIHNCDYCLCTCEDNVRKDIRKYVNLVPVSSDYDDNKVITGVQIVNVNNVFHMKVEQGMLLPKGRINSSSVEWKEVSAYAIDDPQFKSGEHYHEITWDHRTFFLDDLNNLDGEVLVSIGFGLDADKNIKLIVGMLPFDRNTGKLEYVALAWSNSSTPIADRKELKPAKYEDPTWYWEHKPDSQSGQFIKLTTSDMNQDVGQNVVPFFDTQPVNSTYPMPLSGAGLIHKGQHGSAGFLALKLFTYDINRLSPECKT